MDVGSVLFPFRWPSVVVSDVLWNSFFLLVSPDLCPLQLNFARCLLDSCLASPARKIWQTPSPLSRYCRIARRRRRDRELAINRKTSWWPRMCRPSWKPSPTMLPCLWFLLKMKCKYNKWSISTILLQINYNMWKNNYRAKSRPSLTRESVRSQWRNRWWKKRSWPMATIRIGTRRNRYSCSWRTCRGWWVWLPWLRWKRTIVFSDRVCR